MTKINLLPWREMRRRQLDLQVLRGSFFAWALMGLLALYVNLHLNGKISAQNVRNDYIQKEIGKLEDQIKEIKELKKKRADLISRMDVIQRLQGDRTRIVHIFDDLVRKLPEGVYLTGFKKKGTTINLTGIAQSNGRISLFMRQLDASEWYTNPRLQVINITQDGGLRVSKFTLQATLAQKKTILADESIN
ncbi:MAG TPA: pilus assembly protein PilN [Acidiferrobacteraceae bacterium]|nr:pilus assembly protein PilN [Acidiferrobacteraceae bacterium]